MDFGYSNDQAASNTADFPDFFSQEEEARWRHDFPHAPRPVWFVRSEAGQPYGAALYGPLMLLRYETSWWAFGAPFLHQESAPAFLVMKDCIDKRSVGVVVGPDVEGVFSKDFVFMSEAQSKVLRDLWDRHAWDHETGHIMSCDMPVPPHLDGDHFRESLADAYAILRGRQRKTACASLARDLILLRRFMGVCDYLHDTEEAIREAQRWAQGQRRLEKMSASEILDISRDIAERTAMGKTESRSLSRALRGRLVSSRSELFEKMMLCAVEIDKPTKSPWLRARKIRFAQAARVVARRIGTDKADLLMQVASVIQPPMDLIALAKETKGYVETSFQIRTFHPSATEEPATLAERLALWHRRNALQKRTIDKILPGFASVLDRQLQSSHAFLTRDETVQKDLISKHLRAWQAEQVEIYRARAPNPQKSRKRAAKTKASCSSLL